MENLEIIKSMGMDVMSGLMEKSNTEIWWIIKWVEKVNSNGKIINDIIKI